MAAFWPTPAGEESDPDVAKAMNTTPKIVISRTLPQATWAGTQIISHHAEEELAKLKQQPGKDIVIAGSSTLTAGLLHTGLLDELRIMVNPVILGQGRSLFAGAGKTSLKLLKTQQLGSPQSRNGRGARGCQSSAGLLAEFRRYPLAGQGDGQAVQPHPRR